MACQRLFTYWQLQVINCTCEHAKNTVWVIDVRVCNLCISFFLFNAQLNRSTFKLI